MSDILPKPTVSADPSQRIFDYLHHLVALCWVDVAGNPNDNVGPRSLCVSGFIMSIENYWVWVTAGHICESIKGILEQGRQIKRLKLYDVWANPQHHPDDLGVPVTWALPPPHIHNESQGLDYGAMVIDSYTRTLLEKGGVIPLDERSWSDVPKDAEIFEMIGIPSVSIESSVDESGDMATIRTQVRPCVAPIEFVANPPPAYRKPFPRFCGRLVDKTAEGLPNGVPLNDIDGMSGCPIFGLRRNAVGTLDYWPIAIQSSWHHSERLIFGCPISGIVSTVKYAVEKSRVVEPG